MGRTAVLGLGNVLMGDDALGPWAIEYLRSRHSFPEDVALEDLGTPGLDLYPHLAGRDAIILIDAIRADGPPGEVRLYRRDEILARPVSARIGPHDPGIVEALSNLELAGDAPEEALLVGVIPESASSGIGLSDAVRGAIPAIEAAVLAELARLGHRVVRRDPPARVDPWWERHAGGADGGRS